MAIEEDIFTIVVSSIIAFGIALFVRYGVKPKFEIVYDSNRKANLTYLFNGISMFDDLDFRSFYEIFEDRMGLLTRDRKDIIPSTLSTGLTPTVDLRLTAFSEIGRLTAEYDVLKVDLRPILEDMKSNFEAFNQQYTFYQTYLHDSFLREVKIYFFNTYYYAEWLLQGQNLVEVADKRLESAFRIIQYLEENSLVDLDIPNMRNFIKKWRDYKMQNYLPK